MHVAWCGVQVLIVESYGGRDEPVDTLTNNFVGVGVEPALDAVRIKEVPNEATYQVKTRKKEMQCWNFFGHDVSSHVVTFSVGVHKPL